MCTVILVLRERTGITSIYIHMPYNGTLWGLTWPELISVPRPSLMGISDSWLPRGREATHKLLTIAIRNSEMDAISTVHEGATEHSTLHGSAVWRSTEHCNVYIIERCESYIVCRQPLVSHCGASAYSSHFYFPLRIGGLLSVRDASVPFSARTETGPEQNTSW